MKKRTLAAFLMICISALLLSGCAEQEEVPKEPPDLVGFWQQPGAADAAYFHRAMIREDNTMSIWWYEPGTDTTRLFWAGTFTPPETGEEPYEWVSTNDLERAQKSKMALREPTKTFTYEDGKITYIVFYGRIKMTGALEKVEKWDP